jgi:O-antigen/teichoic acid export membrane protein
MKDFREKTVSGLVWSAGSQAGRQMVVLLANVALARLLTPGDFGIIATALIFSNFAFVIAEQGLSLALIQKEDVGEEHLSSIFWINIATGCGLSALFLLGAPELARVYGEPSLAPVMRIIASMFLIYPLGMIHKVILTRRLEFRSIAVVEVLSAWIGGTAAVAMAWKGAGIYSIALQFVIEFVISAVALWTLCDWRPRLIFRWRAVRDLTGFSTNLLATSVLNYWVRNVDNLLVGFYLGAFELGLYSRAYAIMLFPLSRVTWVFSRVMVRSFTLIRGDQERVRSVFLKMSRVVGLITFPMMLGVAASAEAFVSCAFGSQWLGMVPVLRILAVVGMVQSITSVVSSLYMSHDMMSLRFRVSLTGQALQVAGIVIGLRWGILGVASCYAAACMLSEPFDCFFGIRIVGLRLPEFLANLRSAFACAVVMALSVAFVDARFTEALSPAPRLGIDVFTGAGVYWTLLHVFEVREYGELKVLLRERLGVLGWAAT